MTNKWLNSTVEAYKRYFGYQPGRPVIVYEVGSRDGHDGVELAERIYDGHFSSKDKKNVVLIEPNPAQAAVIRQNYPDATLLEFAASDKDGVAPFLCIEGNIDAIGSSSLDLQRQHHKPGYKKVIKVETRRLEPILAKLRHSEIDIMKIDAEGYTYEILQGLGSRLSDIKVLHLETEMEGHLVTNKTNKEVFDLMREAGFLCFALEYEWGGIEDQVWVNAEAMLRAK